MGGNGELDYQWEPVGYEELAWRVDHDALEGVPKSRRRKITGTYRAAVPFELRDKDVLIPAELQSRMEEVAATICQLCCCAASRRQVRRSRT